MTDYKFEFSPLKKCRILTLNGEPLYDANRFLQTLVARGLSPLTMRAYGFDLLYLFRWLSQVELEINDLTQSDLVGYIHFQRKNKAKPKSINRRLTVCESYYRYLFNKPISPAPKVNYPAPYYMGSGYDHKIGMFRMKRRSNLKLHVKIPQTLIEPLTVYEVNAFLKEVTRYRDLTIVLMMLCCGLRSCEVLSLKISFIDFRQRQLKVLGKGSKERMLPLPEQVFEAAYRYLHLERPCNCKDDLFFVVLQGSRVGQSMTPAGLRSLFRYRCQKTKITQATPHRWRHTFGTEMARSGMAYHVLQKIMGHAEGSRVTEQYIHLSMADIFEEYNKALERIQKYYEDEDTYG